MDSRQELFLRVRRAVAEALNVPPDKISEESLFLEDLGATSLDLVMLGMLLEEELGIEISHDDFRPLKSIRSTLDYLLENYSLGQKQAV